MQVLWKRVADMNFRLQSNSGGGRRYPTLIALATGEVLAMSGHPAVGDDQGSSFQHNNNIPEKFSLYTPPIEMWRYLNEGGIGSSDLAVSKLLHRCNSRDKTFCTASYLDSSRGGMVL
jgi:hypothetical protein